MVNATIAKKTPAAVKESEDIEETAQPSLIDWKTIWIALSEGAKN